MAYSVFSDINIKGILSVVPSKKPASGSDLAGVYLADIGQTASDLGYMAAHRLIDEQQVSKDEIGVLIFATKTPDYRGPASAAVLQGRLGLETDCLCYDVNTGSTGFILGLQIVASHLKTLNKPIGLLVVGDTTSKQFSPQDMAALKIGDGAAAVLIENSTTKNSIRTYTRSYSEQYADYTIDVGGFRDRLNHAKQLANYRSIEHNYLQINEERFLAFAYREVPSLMDDFLSLSGSEPADYDALVLHHYNSASLEGLTTILGASFSKILNSFSNFGNTFGNSIPLLLSSHFAQMPQKELRVLTCAYGEGLSVGMMDLSIDTWAIYKYSESDFKFDEGIISHE